MEGSMASEDLRQLLQAVGGWEGFEIARWTVDDTPAPDAFGLPAPQLTIALRPKADVVRRCSRCGAVVDAVHDVSERYTAQVLDRVRFDEANRIVRPARHDSRAFRERRGSTSPAKASAGCCSAIAAISARWRSMCGSTNCCGPITPSSRCTC
jgi:hypothetical protein